MFFKFWYDSDISGISNYELIKETFFKSDRLGNFRHRYKFHRLLAEETNILNIARKRFHDNDHLPQICLFDPYEYCFLKDDFLGSKVIEPLDKNLRQIFKDSMLLYNDLIPHEKFGFSEVLKTIMQCLLLKDNKFSSEQNLSKWVLDNGDNIGLTFYKSSKPVLRMGRGFFVIHHDKTDLFTYFTYTKNF